MVNDELLNEFRKYLKKRNLSGNSITAYAGSVRLFFTLYDEVTPENLQHYKSYLIPRYRPATVNQRIYAINHFSHFLTETSEVDSIVLASYRLPSV